MSEYYFDFWQWRDLKWCIEADDMEGIQDLVHAVEMRNFTLKMSQAEMIVDYKYFNNTEE